MARSLRGFIATALAAPVAFDRTVDAQVAWDLIDLPFTVDESLLSRASPLLLQDWHGAAARSAGDAEPGPSAGPGPGRSPIDDELLRLHDQFRSMLTHVRPEAKASAQRPAAAAAGQRQKPNPVQQRFLHHLEEQPEDRPAASGIGEELASATAAAPSWDSFALEESFAAAEREARPAELPDANRPASRRASSSPEEEHVRKHWDDFETRFGSSETKSAGDVQSPDDFEHLFGNPGAEQETRAAKKKPLVWVHVHKAGGSLMCEMAKRNERVVIPEENCNWKGHDSWFQSGKPALRVPCSQRARMFHLSGYTYGQIEREMDEDELCDEFRYGVMLREPLSLMHSIMNFEMWYNEKFAHKNLGVPPDLIEWVKGKIDEGAVPGNQFHNPWGWLDNFQTRLLANAFDVPMGQINSEHLARARSFLQNYNFTVHILEELPTRGAELFNELGWTFSPNALHKKVNKLAREERRFMPEEKEYLKDLNQFDYELYNGARGFY